MLFKKKETGEFQRNKQLEDIKKRWKFLPNLIQICSIETSIKVKKKFERRFYLEDKGKKGETKVKK